LSSCLLDSLIGSFTKTVNVSVAPWVRHRQGGEKCVRPSRSGFPFDCLQEAVTSTQDSRCVVLGRLLPPRTFWFFWTNNVIEVQKSPDAVELCLWQILIELFFVRALLGSFAKSITCKQEVTGLGKSSRPSAQNLLFRCSFNSREAPDPCLTLAICATR